MVEITERPIDRNRVLSGVTSPEAGALVTFEGWVRNSARGKTVTHLFYEAHPTMAISELERVRRLALQTWELTGVAIAHRTGRLEIGEISVMIAVSAPHRAAAFEACRYIIDTLKVTVPIWKKEFCTDGETWIEGPEASFGPPS